MPSLNRVEIIGHVGGKKPELRFTETAKSVTNFSVATNSKHTAGTGEVIEETEWFTVVVWNKLAEQCAKYVSKGMLVYITGRVHLHKWKNSNNEDASRIEVTAQIVQFLSRPELSTKTEAEEEDNECPY